MVASRRLGLVAVTVTVAVLGLTTACNGGRAATASTATSPPSSIPASGTSSASSEPTPAAKALDFDCQKLLPRTRALLGTATVSAAYHNPPGGASMPTSEAEWAKKNFDTYPGTSCGFDAEDTFEADEPNYSMLGIDIYQPGTWYRDHILFGDSPMGFDCEPAELPGATRAEWCKNHNEPIYLYSADYGVALVQVNAQPDSSSASAVRSAIEADLAALTF